MDHYADDSDDVDPQGDVDAEDTVEPAGSHTASSLDKPNKFVTKKAGGEGKKNHGGCKNRPR